MKNKNRPFFCLALSNCTREKHWKQNKNHLELMNTIKSLTHFLQSMINHGFIQLQPFTPIISERLSNSFIHALFAHLQHFPSNQQKFDEIKSGNHGDLVIVIVVDNYSLSHLASINFHVQDLLKMCTFIRSFSAPSFIDRQHIDDLLHLSSAHFRQSP